jgi:hypothetical protein
MSEDFSYFSREMTKENSFTKIYSLLELKELAFNRLLGYVSRFLILL